MARSSRGVFYFHKYKPLAIALIALSVVVSIGGILSGVDNQKEDIQGMIFMAIIAIYQLGKFYYLHNKLIYVTLTDKYLINSDEDVAMDWNEVTEINFSFFGLYRVRHKGLDYFLAPDSMKRALPFFDFSSDKFSMFMKNQIRIREGWKR